MLRAGWHMGTATLDAEATVGPVAENGGAEPAAGAPHHGDRVGRHIVLDRLAGGGMGVVYVAYDPQLDRKVAIKLLRGTRGAGDPRALQREAQAMAKLQHPNVVTVYDVGEHAGQVYVAMELVQGGSLRQWVRAAPRSWAETLDVFLAAGRGLWAAHERGLVHRDFKPDNVMVSDEGRVLVMDFGLARAIANTGTREDTIDLGTLGSDSGAVTTVGRVVGTPSYMAPEQFEVASLTAAVDQFAFCVSLWEAVWGERPFAGETVAERYVNASRGAIRTPPARAAVPGWLRAALQRGLAPKPEARWPSMLALLDALERGRKRRRRRSLLLAPVVVAATGGAWGWQQHEHRQRADAIAACAAEGAAVDAVWNDAARERVRAALMRTGASFAARSVAFVEPALDAYRSSWHAGAAQACAHATIDRDWGDDLRERSRWCLEDRKLQLEATVEQLSRSSVEAARRGVRLPSYLDPVSTCLDPKLLQRLPAPPPELRDEIRSIRAAIDGAEAQRHAGRYADALAQATPARSRAEALGWPTLTALARFVEGRCAHEAGESEHAAETLVRAYFEAHEVGALEVAFRAARSLATVESRLERYHEAAVWLQHSEVLSTTLEDRDALDAAEGHYLAGSIHFGLSEYDAAGRETAEAVSLRAALLGAEHPITAAAARNLGLVYLAQGRLDEALAQLGPARAVWESAVGTEHPYIADLAMGMGEAQWGLGQLDAALESFEQALVVQDRTLAADHPKARRNLETLDAALGPLAPTESAVSPTRRRIADLRQRLGRPAID